MTERASAATQYLRKVAEIVHHVVWRAAGRGFAVLVDPLRAM